MQKILPDTQKKENHRKAIYGVDKQIKMIQKFYILLRAINSVTVRYL